MLFDFKGGSAFRQIAALEHSLGLVTDLSQAQAERTLEGVCSELTRREELFLEAGAGVIATAAPSPALWGRLPWPHHARTAGEHMLLSPTPRSQSDVFATAVPLLVRPIPGRAVHLRTAGAEVIQWMRHRADCATPPETPH